MELRETHKERGELRERRQMWPSLVMSVLVLAAAAERATRSNPARAL